MSKDWYPIINYEKCTSCLSCHNFCTHKVFEVKEGKPFVKNPENCVEFCKGCQKGACNNNAITYHRDKGGKKK